MLDRDGNDLSLIASKIRGRLVQLAHQRGVAHLGSALSCVDILVELYWRQLSIDPVDPHHPERDVFLLSKGHAATALYITLSMRGFFPEEWLGSVGTPGASLGEQPIPRVVPGVEAATGSLGHGLPLAIGFAVADRISRQSSRAGRRFVVLMSDGECNEGSVWEAAMMAPAQELGLLTVVVDHNKWQATDRTRNVLSLEPLADKFSAFGWATKEVDGHDFEQLHDALSPTRHGSSIPTAIIAHTVKGKGISFMEDDNNWHYRIPDAEEVGRAHRELGLIVG